MAASDAVVCFVLPLGRTLDRLFVDHPHIHVHFLKYILRRATTTVSRLNRELRILAS